MMRGPRPIPLDAVGASEEHHEHFACPFCASFDVNRLYIASSEVDSCECSSCGARWDEDAKSGEYRGRATKSSVLVRRRNR